MEEYNFCFEPKEKFWFDIVYQAACSLALFKLLQKDYSKWNTHA